MSDLISGHASTPLSSLSGNAIPVDTPTASSLSQSNTISASSNCANIVRETASSSALPPKNVDVVEKEVAVKPLKVHKKYFAEVVLPHTFDANRHYYPRIVNAKLHANLEEFLRLSNERIAARYCQLHSDVTKEQVLSIINHPTKLFRWAGADLFNVMDSDNHRQMVVVETNSCPSGQKSMPMATGKDDEQNGYHTLMREVFAPWIREETAAGNLPSGYAAVVYDKNPMEALGYAAALSTVLDEPVITVQFYHDDPDAPVVWRDGVMHVRTTAETRAKLALIPTVQGVSDAAIKSPAGHSTNGDSEDILWLPIRAAFRYVTQKPWTRLPLAPKTLLMNPIEACIAGGRNKLSAAMAYQRLNDSLPAALRIRAPLTVMDVPKHEVAAWIDRMGGWAVVKVPYANAGQGVWTVTSAEERDAVVAMAEKGTYDRFVVQQLVGVREWKQNMPRIEKSGKDDSFSQITISASSTSLPSVSPLTHVGTMPNSKSESFVCDLRMMVCATPKGFKPLAVYARRALSATSTPIHSAASAAAGSASGKSLSWDVLGTNLSVKLDGNAWDSDTNRLIGASEREWGVVGVSIDDLIDAYVQTCLATTAIDADAVSVRAKGLEGVRDACRDEALVAETVWQWK